MKIAFYINILANGGAERVVANLANAFSQDNDVLVITSFPCSNEYVLNENVTRVNIEHSEKKGNFFLRNARRTIGLRRILKKYKPDTLVSFMGEPNFRSIVASAGLKIRTVISVRNDPQREYGSLLTRFLAKTLFRFANHIVFQTEDARCWFPKSIQKKSSIILNPVNDVFFNTHFTGDRHDIVSTGRLVFQKNHELLIKAFSRIADKLEENLFIYGEGPLRLELENLVFDLNMQDRIFLPGSVKNVAEIIKSAKLFVLSSDYEGMPNSLMEAMTLGIPCLSTDCPCGGPRMLLNEKFLVPVREQTQLEKAILRIKDNQSCKDNYKVKPDYFRLEAIMNDWYKVLL